MRAADLAEGKPTSEQPKQREVRAKLKLAWLLEYDWQTWLAMGKPKAENDNYHYWRVNEGKSGAFDVPDKFATAHRQRWYQTVRLKEHR